MRPARTSVITSSQSSTLVELTVAARSPARAAAAIWSRISASSGETTRVGPPPASRSAAVAAQYTADLPQPVAWTTSTRRRWSTSSSTAVSWSGRGRASGPAIAATTRSRAARLVNVVVLDTMPAILPPLPTGQSMRVLSAHAEPIAEAYDLGRCTSSPVRSPAASRARCAAADRPRRLGGQALYFEFAAADAQRAGEFQNLAREHGVPTPPP